MFTNGNYIWKYLLPASDRYFNILAKDEAVDIEGNEDCSITGRVQAKSRDGEVKLKAEREPMPGNKRQTESNRFRYSRILPLKVLLETKGTDDIKISINEKIIIDKQQKMQIWFFSSNELAAAGASLWLMTEAGDILLDGDCNGYRWSLCTADISAFDGYAIIGLKISVESACNASCYFDGWRIGRYKGFNPKISKKTSEGSLILEPQSVMKGNQKTVSIIYIVEKPMEAGALLKIGTPAKWWMQNNAPEGNYYISCSCELPGGIIKYIPLECVGNSNTTRYRIDTIACFNEMLPAASKVVFRIDNILWGEDRKLDSKEFGLYIKKVIDEDYSVHVNQLFLRILPSESSSYRLTLQSAGNNNITCRIASIDCDENLCTHDNNNLEININADNRFSSTAKVKLKSGIADLVLAGNAGLLQVSAVHHLGKNIVSNYYASNFSDMKPYFGYLHGHSSLSVDGCQDISCCYRYGRDNAHLDFCSISDHLWASEPLWKWEYILESTARLNNDGHYVTIPGYEWSSQDHGDRNVYFVNENEALPPQVDPIESKPDELYKQLKNSKAIVIPHSTAYEVRARGINWNYHHSELERITEIFSLHGNSENTVNNPYPLKNSAMKPHVDYNTIQSALNKGYRLGFIAGGDNHRKPLPENSGIAGVWAKECTREAIWEALYNRRCFGTTGPRIIVNFKVNSVFMGGVAAVNNLYEERIIEYRIISDIPVERIELIKNGRCTQITRQQDSKTVCIEGVWTDSALILPNSYYYLRVKCRNKHMAWSSPVWLELGHK